MLGGNAIIGAIFGQISRIKGSNPDKVLWIFENAKIHGFPEINATGHIYGNAEIYGGRISGKIIIYGNSKIFNDPEIKADESGSIVIRDNAQVYGSARLENRVRVYDNAQVYDRARLRDDARIYGNAHAYGESEMDDGAELYGNAHLFGNSRMSDWGKVSDHA